MPNIVRQGDINTAGGVATVGAATVKCEGAAVMLPGSPVTPHPPCPVGPAHCAATTIGGSSTVMCEGRPIIHSLDIDTCGHKRATFAATVKIGP